MSDDSNTINDVLDVLDVLDVRAIGPRERHPLIFATFDALHEGEQFTLVNDHDPMPLYYQFLHIRENQFFWEYLEQGPEVWQVRIGRSLKNTGATTL